MAEVEIYMSESVMNSDEWYQGP